MIVRKHFIAIAVGACLLGLAGLSSQKNPVERPLKGWLHISGTFTVDETGNFTGYEASGEGIWTHLGRVTVHVAGYFNPLTGEADVQGVIKAANGDELCCHFGDPTTVVFTGGTGRFTGATGSFYVVDPEIIWLDPLTFEGWHGVEGTISY